MAILRRPGFRTSPTHCAPEAPRSTRSPKYIRLAPPEKARADRPASVADPIATGLVESLAHPGGNITGVTTLSPGRSGKRIEVLREIKPEIRSIAFLGLRNDQNTETFLHDTQAAADQLGITLIEPLADNPNAIDEALFMDLQRRHVEAVVVQPAFLGSQDRIVGLAMKYNLPVIADRPVWAQAGALLTYGPDTTAQLHRAAYYVDRILKGTKSSELPVEHPQRSNSC